VKFRPALWPTVFTVPVVLLMLGLSVWQIQRLHWKEGLIAERSQRMDAAAVGDPGAGPLDAQGLADLEYRHVRLEGQFLNDKEMFLGARTFEGSAGYHVLTPFRLADGRVLIADRGWIPLERKDVAKRRQGEIEGPTTFDGIIRLQGRQTWFVPDNRPDLDFFFWVDLPAMAKLSGLADVETRFYAEAGSAANPGGYPIGGQSHVELPNDHLQYAITWFALAIALMVIYVVYHVQQGRAELKPDKGAPKA
jgi:surfeit locus 1 family protein